MIDPAILLYSIAKVASGSRRVPFFTSHDPSRQFVCSFVRSLLRSGLHNSSPALARGCFALRVADIGWLAFKTRIYREGVCGKEGRKEGRRMGLPQSHLARSLAHPSGARSVRLTDSRSETMIRHSSASFLLSAMAMHFREPNDPSPK